MRPTTQNRGLLFGSVVGFLLVLVAWWVFFLVNESFRLDQATELVKAGKTSEALTALGATDGEDFSAKAAQYRSMFVAEGVVMGLLVLIGVFLLYRALLTESRLREQQERFLTGTTHRLKTPLATVRLGIESMLAGSLPEEKREHYLKAMAREIGRLEADVTNLLTAGGLDNAKETLEFMAADLAADVREAAEAMLDRFDAAGVELELDVADSVPVQRNRSAIRLVLHNLLDNAAKYSATGGHVVLRLAREGKDALLSVRDDGRGIAPEDLPHVFERFYCGTTSGHEGGSGLGLYLAQQLVQSHGGALAVTSQGIDTGTEFTIRLPLDGGES